MHDRLRWQLAWGQPLFFTALLAIVVSAACQGSEGLPDYPTLVFGGRVLDASAAAVPSIVRLTQHVPDGCTSEVIVTDPLFDETDAAGVFEIRYFASTGLDGCFKLVALTLQDSIPMDSVLLFAGDLHEKGDPLGTGRIDVDIIIRN